MMRANRAYHLIVSRDGLGPAFLTGGERSERIELVSIDDGEVALFWDLPAKRAARVLRRLRADFVEMEADAFFAKWSAATLR